MKITSTPPEKAALRLLASYWALKLAARSFLGQETRC
jgi:hypothetical protein